MGRLSELLREKSSGKARTEFTRNAAATSDGSRLWDQVFGGTSKEDLHRSPKVRSSVAGGSYGQSATNDPAIMRLLQAYRSMAPGGWTDDRYEQSRHFVGVNYIAIHRKAEQLAQSEFQVFRKDPESPEGMRPVTPDDPPEGEHNDKPRHCRPYDLVKLLERPNRDDSFGDLLYCFPSGTRVRMADGSLKQIQDVRLSEEVLSAEGNVRRVLQTHVREYVGDLVTLNLWGHSHLKMTPNHKVLTRRGYVRVDSLTKNDWVAVPRYAPTSSRVLQTAYHVAGETTRTKSFYSSKSYGRESSDKPSTGGTPWANYKKIPDLVDLTPGFGRILGLFLAEGHYQKYSLVWSFNTDERDTLVADLVKLLKDELGLDSSVQTINEWGTCTQVVANGSLWVRLFRSLCGKGAGDKRLHADILSGPREFLAGLFQGWMEGDGCKICNRHVGVSVSHDLIMSMYDIANYIGLRPAIACYKPVKTRADSRWNIQGKRDSWHLLVGTKKDNYRVRTEDRVTWRRVRSIARTPFKGDVYDIGVDMDHSFVAEGIGVHNCMVQQLDLTGTALTWMVPNKFEEPFQLYPVPTAVAIPQPAINPEFPDGYYRIQPLYPYGPFSSYPTPTTAVGAPIPAQWMLRIQYTHPLLRYEGWSPLTGLRLQSDSLDAIDSSRFYKMQRTFNPDAVVQFDDMPGAQPLPEPEIERLRVQWGNAFQGPQNAGNILFSPPGSRIETFGTSPRDMDFQAGWEQLMSFMLSGFGITKPAAGMIEDASYASLYATLKQLYWLTLEPMANKIAAKLTRHVAPFFGDDLIVKIRCRRIDDHDIEFTKFDKGATGKCMTKNEGRKILGMAVTDEPWGDEILGHEDPPEQPGMPGMPGQEGQQGGAIDQLASMMDGAEDVGEAPTPGKLSQGSLGPKLKAHIIK